MRKWFPIATVIWSSAFIAHITGLRIPLRSLWGHLRRFKEGGKTLSVGSAILQSGAEETSLPPDGRQCHGLTFPPSWLPATVALSLKLWASLSPSFLNFFPRGILLQQWEKVINTSHLYSPSTKTHTVFYTNQPNTLKGICTNEGDFTALKKLTCVGWEFPSGVCLPSKHKVLGSVSSTKGKNSHF